MVWRGESFVSVFFLSKRACSLFLGVFFVLNEKSSEAGAMRVMRVLPRNKILAVIALWLLLRRSSFAVMQIGAPCSHEHANKESCSSFPARTHKASHQDVSRAVVFHFGWCLDDWFSVVKLFLIRDCLDTVVSH